MKTGVLLRLGVDAGELFADARALESAGADSLWVFERDGQDAWALLAAIAAVTWRARLVAVDARERPGARETVERLSQGRLVPARRETDTLVLATEAETERWFVSDFPNGRAAWKQLRAEREASGFSGIVIPNDPRLLDLLRNPDLEDDRADLKQAFG